MMPNTDEETLRRYETAHKQLVSDGLPSPRDIDAAIAMLRGSTSDTREVHEQYLRIQLTRGTHAAIDHVALGRLLAQDGRHQEAIDQFETAIAIDGDLPDLDLERATCLYMLQRDEEAWGLLERPLADEATLAVHLCNQIAARRGFDISRCTVDELDELPW